MLLAGSLGTCPLPSFHSSIVAAGAGGRHLLLVPHAFAATGVGANCSALLSPFAATGGGACGALHLLVAFRIAGEAFTRSGAAAGGVVSRCLLLPSFVAAGDGVSCLLRLSVAAADDAAAGAVAGR